MTKLGWMSCAFGMVVIDCIIAVLAYDPWAICNGRLTVSRYTLLTAIACQLFAALVVAVLTLPLGILLGHLLWAANGTGRPWTALVVGCLALAAGIVIGHKWFAQ